MVKVELFLSDADQEKFHEPYNLTMWIYDEDGSMSSVGTSFKTKEERARYIGKELIRREEVNKKTS